MAQLLTERYHAGLIDAKAFADGLAAMVAAEFATELGIEPESIKPEQLPPGVRDVFAEYEAEYEDQVRRMFPTRADAPGLWLVLGNDRCHFCGRTLAVLALKADGDSAGAWVHICLDDLELIRSQAETALKP